MDSALRGSFRLFRLADVDVYLHWTWFLVAFWQISIRREEDYAIGAWKVAEYVSLFGIVLLHEFGHALACRSVGGRAEHIVLWPLGGIAYVAPPARPGAFLWSIAAGPLVNVVLVPITLGMVNLVVRMGWASSLPDLYLFLRTMVFINLGLLIFNLIPIYPLDGGQILQALLWYGMGRWYSLLVVSAVGLILGGLMLLGCFLLLLLSGANPGLAGTAILLGLIAAFITLRSLVSLQHARGALALEALPRHEHLRCPNCQVAPPQGPFWVCEHCQSRFDLFDSRGNCPGCGAWYLRPTCPHCQEQNHIDRWVPTEPGI